MFSAWADFRPEPGLREAVTCRRVKNLVQPADVEAYRASKSAVVLDPWSEEGVKAGADSVCQHGSRS